MTYWSDEGGKYEKESKIIYKKIKQIRNKIAYIEAQFPTSFPSTNKVRNAIKKLQDFDDQINVINAIVRNLYLIMVIK